MYVFTTNFIKALTKRTKAVTDALTWSLLRLPGWYIDESRLYDEALRGRVRQTPRTVVAVPIEPTPSAKRGSRKLERRLDMIRNAIE